MKLAKNYQFENTMHFFCYFIRFFLFKKNSKIFGNVILGRYKQNNACYVSGVNLNNTHFFFKTSMQ